MRYMGHSAVYCSTRVKGDRQFGDVNVTAFANYGREHYDGGNSPSVQQYYLGGPTYAALGPNPFTAQYTGYNNSEKQTDMEYINLKADYFGFHLLAAVKIRA